MCNDMVQEEDTTMFRVPLSVLFVLVFIAAVLSKLVVDVRRPKPPKKLDAIGIAQLMVRHHMKLQWSDNVQFGTASEWGKSVDDWHCTFTAFMESGAEVTIDCHYQPLYRGEFKVVNALTQEEISFVQGLAQNASNHADLSDLLRKLWVETRASSRLAPRPETMYPELPTSPCW